MEQRHYPQGAHDALVLLPGAQMHPADAELAGLPALLQASGVALDLWVPDLHIDPAGQRDAQQLLATEVLAPLSTRYRRLWLAGISLGGLLALLQAQRAPRGLSGLCLIAPYPGSRLTLNTIARAGGLAAWQPTPEQRADPEFELWSRLRAGPPPLSSFIGWGRGDRFAAGMAALAGQLPQADRHEVDGGHDWPAWRPLWRSALAWIARQQQGAA